jgi:hypothetical protein
VPVSPPPPQPARSVRAATDAARNGYVRLVLVDLLLRAGTFGKVLT